MAEFQFKTNIKCGGCIATVTPFLEGEPRISNWKVDLESPDRILSVETEGMDAGEVASLVKSAGYEAEEKKKSLIGRLFGK